MTMTLSPFEGTDAAAPATAEPAAGSDQSAAPAPTPHRFWSGAWAVLNSSFLLWALSSVLLGGGTCLYHLWQESRQQQTVAATKVGALDVEIAGRLAQFGKWANANLLVRSGAGFDFRKPLSNAEVVTAITQFADRPRQTRAAGAPYIEEMYAEFAERDLISLYAELNAINNRRLEAACPNDACAGAGSRPDDERQLLRRRAEYKSAMVAILDPAYLLRYQPRPEHTIFVGAFEGIFLTAEIRRSGLPYTDALENCGGVACPRKPVG